MPDDDEFPNFPDDFFKNIQKFIEDMLKNSDFSDFEKLFEEGFGKNPFVWGFSFNKGPDGKPKFEQFGDFINKMGIKTPDEPPLEHERIREPMTDVIEDRSQIRVIVELPGVEKNQIDLSSTEMVVKIKAQSEHRFYRKEVKLPEPVLPTSAKAKFNNGVLEITFDRINPEYTNKINID